MVTNTAIPFTSEIDLAVKSQARLRVMAGIPVLVLGLIAVTYLGTPFGEKGTIAVGIIAVIHALYMFVALFLAARIGRVCSARTLVYATAVLDPLMLSGWLAMTGETGALFICFYLFTILGFGFRIGTAAMWTCQIASLLGFTLVLTIAPVWQLHPILGLSFFSILVVVPLYATGLIKNLRTAHARAAFESQAKSQLLAKVSHELRTPLSGIIASAELLASETADPLTSARSDLILNLSNDLLLEINDLLDTAKLEADALTLESAQFDLNAVMEQIRLTFASTAAAKKIGFRVRVDPDIANMVLGDVHYLGRVLKNLVGNALKFTSRGEVEITLALLEQDAGHYRIRFSVRDTGIGIPDALHQQIFEPFFQASAGTARQYGGTGLGMSLAKDIVNLMGSEIVVESEVGIGSKFHFDVSLPIVTQSEDAVAATAPAPVVCGKRILVADDYATNLHLIQELLLRDRHQVAIAGNGEAALTLLASEVFDIVFLDYHMGDMDGGQVLQLYQFGTLERAPVFFLTADTMPATTAKLMGIGAAGVLHKPITSDALRRAIAQVCAADSMPGADAMPAAPLAPARLRPASLLTSVAPQYLDHGVIDELKALSPRPEFLGQIVNSARIDIERNCANLLLALRAEDVPQVHDTAHALSGICISVGAVRLAAIAGKLMRIDRWDLLSSRQDWERDVDAARDQTLAALRGVLHEIAVAQ